jgi:hypothetical protein
MRLVSNNIAFELSNTIDQKGERLIYALQKNAKG